MEHCIIDDFLFKKVLMEHLETGIKVKDVTFNKIIKIIVSPLWILKGEFFASLNQCSKDNWELKAFQMKRVNIKELQISTFILKL